MRAADKLLILHSIRDIKMEINKIIKLISMLDPYNKNEIYQNIDNTTMRLVIKYRKIQEIFNEKFKADAYINIKTEEWRRFVRSLRSKKSKQHLMEQLNNFKFKTNIEAELLNYEYTEKLDEWLRIMVNQKSIASIFNIQLQHTETYNNL
jgi:hypothetical protein